jgi:ferredoxin
VNYVIITAKKNFEEIEEMLKPYNKVFVGGCGTCSTVCQTGGEEEVKEMVEKLGDRVVGSTVFEEPCDARVLKRDLKAVKDQVEDAEVILMLCCGAGDQVVSEITHKFAMPGLNTIFLGETERIGRFREMCKLCGECVLHETGSICPITRCAKGLLNGPCGGYAEGKCEVGNYEKDCAWCLIYEKLKEFDRLDLYTKFRLPRDWSIKSSPQDVMTR